MTDLTESAAEWSPITAFAEGYGPDPDDPPRIRNVGGTVELAGKIIRKDDGE
jgi:hypothetical protein